MRARPFLPLSFPSTDAARTPGHRLLLQVSSFTTPEEGWTHEIRRKHLSTFLHLLGSSFQMNLFCVQFGILDQMKVFIFSINFY